MASSEASQGLTSIPIKPYVTKGDLTPAVVSFLSTVFDLFTTNAVEKLDKGGIMAVLILAYPDKKLQELHAKVLGLLEMCGEEEELTFDQFFDINLNSAKASEASFGKMLKNLFYGYKDHAACNTFLSELEKMGLPRLLEPLQIIHGVRENEKKKKDLKSSSGSESESSSSSSETIEKKDLCLTSLDFAGALEKIASAQNIITMAGAGISTSCGIPDFRSKGTGLYDNLQKYDLPSPQSVFDINYFKLNPEPFFHLSKEIYPDNFFPSPTHYFISCLAQKGKLTRHYTQNIDMLERIAGVPHDLLVEAHGSYNTATCINEICGETFDKVQTRKFVFGNKIPKCPKCDELVKPDITFFGEGLPPRFNATLKEDFEKCDLLIVMGSSLVVAPFCTLINNVKEDVPRLLINWEVAAESEGSGKIKHPIIEALEEIFATVKQQQAPFWAVYKEFLVQAMPNMNTGGTSEGFVFPPKEDAYRDVFLQGKCDETISQICTELGWMEDLENIIQTGNEKIKLIQQELKLQLEKLEQLNN